MESNATLAIIAAVQLLLFTFLQWWLGQLTKREDYRRQDELAARVKHVVNATAEAQRTLDTIVDTTDKVHNLADKIIVAVNGKTKE